MLTKNEYRKVMVDFLLRRIHEAWDIKKGLYEKSYYFAINVARYRLKKFDPQIGREFDKTKEEQILHNEEYCSFRELENLTKGKLEKKEFTKIHIEQDAIINEVAAIVGIVDQTVYNTYKRAIKKIIEIKKNTDMYLPIPEHLVTKKLRFIEESVKEKKKEVVAAKEKEVAKIGKRGIVFYSIDMKYCEEREHLIRIPMGENFSDLSKESLKVLFEGQSVEFIKFPSDYRKVENKITDYEKRLLIATRNKMEAKINYNKY